MNIQDHYGGKEFLNCKYFSGYIKIYYSYIKERRNNYESGIIKAFIERNN